METPCTLHLPTLPHQLDLRPCLIRLITHYKFLKLAEVCTTIFLVILCKTNEKGCMNIQTSLNIVVPEKILKEDSKNL